MLKSLTAILAISFLVSACSGVSSTKVASLQKKDKFLSCKEIMLEQNEAAFFRKTAEKNKGPSFRNVVMPLGYISTYVDAEKAIEASDSRIEYLNRIYDILDCDNPDAEANKRGLMPTAATKNSFGGANGYNTQQAAFANPYREGGSYDEWY